MYLETERLVLRGPKEADAQAYLTICNSEFVLRYNAMSTSTMESIQAAFSGERESTLLLERKADSSVIGAVFLEEDSLRWGVASRELSYFLREDCSRQGYMKEALCAVIGHLFDSENIECVAARSFAPNTASRKLLESLGFHQDGYIPRCVKGYGGIVYDDTLYSLFREMFLPAEKRTDISY